MRGWLELHAQAGIEEWGGLDHLAPELTARGYPHAVGPPTPMRV